MVEDKEVGLGRGLQAQTGEEKLGGPEREQVVQTGSDQRVGVLNRKALERLLPEL